jgi:anti-sigma regulatory factor (Ser/Thr protein kinase)
MNPAPQPGRRVEWKVPGCAESVRACRVLARALAGDEAQAEAAALCVSELVTNALVHTCSGLPGGSLTVWFETSPAAGSLRIGVEDDGARIPVSPRSAAGVPGAAESGYGLDIVAAVAAEWGVALGANDRRVTWCVVPVTGGRR